MNEPMNIGILGCGDFLRWQEPSLRKSRKMRTALLYDPDSARAETYAAKLGGRAVAGDDEIFDSPDIDAVCLFVPPWVRRTQVERAAKAGKHIITTKPLSASLDDCEAMRNAVRGKVRCGVIYSRTEDAMVETCKQLLEDGELGRLALYRQDWLHHYPQWNDWALDPERNGGPFMDAMIHNLNTARYLMGRNVTCARLFSANVAHPDIPCADTESMIVDFEGKALANLFITWAADLAVFSTEGNDREHIDILYMVTERGWRLTVEKHEGRPVIRASRLGEERTFPFRRFSETVYDRFAQCVETDGDLPPDLPGLDEATDDIRLILTS